MRSTQRRGASMSSTQLYDVIGTTYTATRRTDPRIAAQIWGALGDARTVLNVGAGSGSYEPADRDVLAVEPSAVMRAQRPPRAAPCLDAQGGAPPVAHGAVGAAGGGFSHPHRQGPAARPRAL